MQHDSYEDGIHLSFEGVDGVLYLDPHVLRIDVKGELQVFSLDEIRVVLRQVLYLVLEYIAGNYA